MICLEMLGSSAYWDLISACRAQKIELSQRAATHMEDNDTFTYVGGGLLTS